MTDDAEYRALRDEQRAAQAAWLRHIPNGTSVSDLATVRLNRAANDKAYERMQKANAAVHDYLAKRSREISD